MKSFETMCDMGSIKIYNKEMSCFFSNNIGDLPNTVKIYEKKRKVKPRNEEFLGHFTVKTEAYLSAYDCADEPIYKFEKGRWFVNLKDDVTFLIEKIDEEIHS